jgi:hypothetical protein
LKNVSNARSVWGENSRQCREAEAVLREFERVYYYCYSGPDSPYSSRGMQHTGTEGSADSGEPKMGKGHVFELALRLKDVRL